MINVFVEEEYGWKNWRWEAPFDTAEELIEWWRGLNGEAFVKSVWEPQRSEAQPPMADLMGGKWYDDEGEHDWEEIIAIHVHEETDTSLSYEGMSYPIGGGTPVTMVDGDEGPDDSEGWMDGAGGYPRIFNPDHEGEYFNE